MKITKTQGIVHAILAVVFTVVYFLICERRDFGVWSFWVCTMLTLVNTLILCGYSNKTHSQGSEMMDYTLFVPPIAAYIVLIFVALKVPYMVHHIINKYLAVLIVVFATAIVVQILLIRGRSANITQESDIREGRNDRFDLEACWSKILTATSADPELNSFAAKIMNDIKYSDPVSIPELSGMEKDIAEKSAALLEGIRSGDYKFPDILKCEKELQELITDRNTKLKNLK
ncbi:MAG: hypothetical protein K5868_01560 [Lachnospiraceae bacterium]|nr:hypothetical protein [Lachnospiraceae bacterium]